MAGTRELSVADVLAWERMPEDVKQLAQDYFAFRLESMEDYDEGLQKGFALGYEYGKRDGLALGRASRGKNKET